jgi:hypothetical protein
MPRAKSELIQTAFRFRQAELAALDEIARRLKASRTETLRLAIHSLRRDLGLLKDDVIDLHERLAREQGDDAELVFTVASVERLAVDVRLGDGEPRDDLRANLLYAMAGFVDDAGVDHLELPPEGAIVMKDLDTGAWYTIGQVELREGAERRVPIRDLGELRQGVRDDRTPEQRRRDLEMNAWLRRIIREHRGLSEPDDDELADA